MTSRLSAHYATGDLDDMPDRRELWGWICFAVCAVIFLAVGIRDGDVLLSVAA